MKISIPTKTPENKDCIDIQYYGEDAKEFLRNIYHSEDIEFIGKDCISDNMPGIIIGIEDCNSAMDYYFIVYVPEKKGLSYELFNDDNFINSIKV